MNDEKDRSTVYPDEPAAKPSDEGESSTTSRSRSNTNSVGEFFASISPGSKIVLGIVGVLGATFYLFAIAFAAFVTGNPVILPVFAGGPPAVLCAILIYRSDTSLF